MLAPFIAYWNGAFDFILFGGGGGFMERREQSDSRADYLGFALTQGSGGFGSGWEFRFIGFVVADFFSESFGGALCFGFERQC